MRRLTFALLIALAPAWAHAAGLSVKLDQAARITLAGEAHDVIVGDPAIADVTVADQRHLIVTGKSFGTTNLVVSDVAGRVLFDREIVVGAADQGAVSVFRGTDSSTYSCSPRCERLAAPGGGGGGGGGAGGAPATPTSPP